MSEKDPDTKDYILPDLIYVEYLEFIDLWRERVHKTLSRVGRLARWREVELWLGVVNTWQDVKRVFRHPSWC